MSKTFLISRALMVLAVYLLMFTPSVWLWVALALISIVLYMIAIKTSVKELH